MTTLREWLNTQGDNDVYKQETLRLLASNDAVSSDSLDVFYGQVVEIFHNKNALSTQNVCFIVKTLFNNISNGMYCVTLLSKLQNNFQNTLSEIIKGIDENYRYNLDFKDKIAKHNNSQLEWLETLSLAEFDLTLTKMKALRFEIDYDSLRYLFWTSHKHQSSKVLEALLNEQSEAEKREEKRPEVQLKRGVEEGILNETHKFSVVLQKANDELATWYHQADHSRLSEDRKKGYREMVKKLGEAGEEQDFSGLVRYCNALRMTDAKWHETYSDRTTGKLEYYSFATERKREIGYYDKEIQSPPPNTLYDWLSNIIDIITARREFFIKKFINNPEQVVLVLNDETLFEKLAPGDLKDILKPWIGNNNAVAEEKILRALLARVEENPAAWVTIKVNKIKLTVDKIRELVSKYDAPLSLHLPRSLENVQGVDKDAPSHLAYQLQKEDVAVAVAGLKNEAKGDVELCQLPENLMHFDENFPKELIKELFKNRDEDKVIGEDKKPIVFAGILFHEKYLPFPYFVHVNPNNQKIKIILANPLKKDNEELRIFFETVVFSGNTVSVENMSVDQSLDPRNSGYNALAVLNDAYTKPLLSVREGTLVFDRSQLTVQNNDQSDKNRQYWSDILYSNTTPGYDYDKNIKRQARVGEEKVDDAAFQRDLKIQFVNYLQDKYRFDPEKNENVVRSELDAFMQGYFKEPGVMYRFERLDAESKKNIIKDVKDYFIRENLIHFHSRKIEAALSDDLIYEIFSTEKNSTVPLADILISRMGENEPLQKSLIFLKENDAKALSLIVALALRSTAEKRCDLIKTEWKEKIKNMSLSEWAGLLPTGSALDLSNPGIKKSFLGEEDSVLDNFIGSLLGDEWIEQTIGEQIAVTAQKEIEEALSQHVETLPFQVVNDLSSENGEYKPATECKRIQKEFISKQFAALAGSRYVTHILDEYNTDFLYEKIKAKRVEILESTDPLVKKLSERFKGCLLFVTRYDEIVKKFDAPESDKEIANILLRKMQESGQKIDSLSHQFPDENTKNQIKQLEGELNLYIKTCLRMAMEDLQLPGEKEKGPGSFVPALHLMLYQALDIPDLGVKGPLFRKDEIKKITKGIVAEYKTYQENPAGYTFFKDMEKAAIERDQYNVRLMVDPSCLYPHQVVIPKKIEDEAKKDKTPVLVCGKHDFFLYRCSGQRWSVIQLDTGTGKDAKEEQDEAIKKQKEVMNRKREAMRSLFAGIGKGEVPTLDRNDKRFNEDVVAVLNQGHHPKTKYDIRMPCKTRTVAQFPLESTEGNNPVMTAQWLTQFVADWQKACATNKTEQPKILQHLIYAVNNIPRETKDNDPLDQVMVDMLVSVNRPRDPQTYVHLMQPLAENEKPMLSTRDFLYVYKYKKVEGSEVRDVYWTQDRDGKIKDTELDPVPEDAKFDSTRDNPKPYTDYNAAKAILEQTLLKGHTSKLVEDMKETRIQWCDLYIKRMLNDIETYGAMVKDGAIDQNGTTAQFIKCLQKCRGPGLPEEQKQRKDEKDQPIPIQTIGDIENIIKEYTRKRALTPSMAIEKMKKRLYSLDQFFPTFDDMDRLKLALTIIKQRRGGDLATKLDSNDLELLASVESHWPRDISLEVGHAAVDAFSALKTLCHMGKNNLKPESSMVRHGAEAVAADEEDDAANALPLAPRR
ncbi:MAG TPA: hypothetical protein VLJ15_05730 [Gammaproteobacteria bacterium]|nr:hypothetical protein [Gammaproteobacteria bacterium]